VQSPLPPPSRPEKTRAGRWSRAPPPLAGHSLGAPTGSALAGPAAHSPRAAASPPAHPCAGWPGCPCCRLVGPTGAPLVAKQLMRLRLSAVWVAMVAFDRPLPVPDAMEGGKQLLPAPQRHRRAQPPQAQAGATIVDGSPPPPLPPGFCAHSHPTRCHALQQHPHRAPRLRPPARSLWRPPTPPAAGAFISGGGPLSWAANNSAKMGLEHPGVPGLECWTLISTNAYGQKNKARTPPPLPAATSPQLHPSAQFGGCNIEGGGLVLQRTILPFLERGSERGGYVLN